MAASVETAKEKKKKRNCQARECSTFDCLLWRLEPKPDILVESDASLAGCLPCRLLPPTVDSQLLLERLLGLQPVVEHSSDRLKAQF